MLEYILGIGAWLYCGHLSKRLLRHYLSMETKWTAEDEKVTTLQSILLGPILLAGIVATRLYLLWSNSIDRQFKEDDGD